MLCFVIGASCSSAWKCQGPGSVALHVPGKRQFRFVRQTFQLLVVQLKVEGSSTARQQGVTWQALIIGKVGEAARPSVCADAVGYVFAAGGGEVQVRCINLQRQRSGKCSRRWDKMQS